MSGVLRRKVANLEKRVSLLSKRLTEVEKRLTEVESLLKTHARPITTIEESDLLLLPDHLRKTFVALAKVGEVDASCVALQTGRARAVESNYLNQLVREDWLSKRRVPRAHNKTLFSVRVKNAKTLKVTEQTMEAVTHEK